MIPQTNKGQGKRDFSFPDACLVSSLRTDGGASRDESSLGYSSAARYTLQISRSGRIRILLSAPAKLRWPRISADLSIYFCARPALGHRAFPHRAPRRVASRPIIGPRVSASQPRFSARNKCDCASARTWGRDGEGKKGKKKERKVAAPDSLGVKARPRCINDERSDTPHPRSGDSDCVSLNRRGIHSEWLR